MASALGGSLICAAPCKHPRPIVTPCRRLAESRRTPPPSVAVRGGQRQLPRGGCVRATPNAVPTPPTEEQDEEPGLKPDEDAEVPGTYYDALNPNTKLGKAVRAACDELGHLGDMELDTLKQCNDLLQKLGYKGSILEPSPPEQQQQSAGGDGTTASAGGGAP